MITNYVVELERGRARDAERIARLEKLVDELRREASARPKGSSGVAKVSPCKLVRCVAAGDTNEWKVVRGEGSR